MREFRGGIMMMTMKMVMVMTVVMVMVMTIILLMLIVTILVRKREGEMMRGSKDGRSGKSGTTSRKRRHQGLNCLLWKLGASI